MMRILVTVVVIVVALLALPAQETRAASGYGYVSYSAGNGLNLRSGPSGNYRVLLTMQAGDRLKIYGERTHWSKVMHLKTGTVGWAWRGYITWGSGGASARSDPAAGGASGLQLCWDTTFNWTACAPLWIAQAIADAARAYGVPYWAMMGIAACESGFDPSAWNPSGVYGLYQFRWSTMNWIYPGGNVWSVYDSAYAAAKLLTIAPAQFDCSWRVGYV